MNTKITKITNIHCKKKASDFPVLFLVRESLVSDIPTGDGKIANLFTVQDEALKGTAKRDIYIY